MSVDDLGSFLRSQRAALSPQRVGVATYDRRRMPGLRREELAQLAGVSVAYYTRLEQGQSANAAEGVRLGGGRPGQGPASSLADGVRDVAMMAAIGESAARGAPVSIASLA